MGIFDKKLREDKLDELSFIECVKWIRERSKGLSYEKGSSDAYSEARELIQYLIKRYCNEYGFTSNNYHNNEIGNLLFSTNVELDDYGKNDKIKSKTISEFKSDIDDFVWRITAEIENQQGH